MKHTFKVGDQIRIRQWDEMEQEFGLNFLGQIKVTFIFIREMIELCGETGIITSIEQTPSGPKFVIDFDNNVRYSSLSYSADMLEYIAKPPDPDPMPGSGARKFGLTRIRSAGRPAEATFRAVKSDAATNASIVFDIVPSARCVTRAPATSALAARLSR